MKAGTSEKIIDEKKIFLLLFTKELILNSQNKVSQLKEIIKQKNAKLSTVPTKKKEERTIEKSKEPLIKSILSSSPKPEIGKNPNEVSVIKPIQINPPRKEIPDGVPKRNLVTLRIPEPRLPKEFQYLRPIPVKAEIDLGKLNLLINDPMVQTIECEGPNKPVIVSGGMGRKPSNVILSNQEIEDTIQRVSKASKIPIETGIYKVVFGHLIFSAVISDVVPSRFIIKKMRTPRNFRQPVRAPNPNYRLFFRK